VTVTKRSYSNTLPGHDKFWTVEVAGSTVFLTYGKNGTKGSTQPKVFRTRHLAEAFATNKIREKLGKGYVPVAAGGMPGAPQMLLDAAVREYEGVATPPGRSAPAGGSDSGSSLQEVRRRARESGRGLELDDD
jgi:predicted DNA-binding WGR domain protein